MTSNFFVTLKKTNSRHFADDLTSPFIFVWSFCSWSCKIINWLQTNTKVWFGPPHRLLEGKSVLNLTNGVTTKTFSKSYVRKNNGNIEWKICESIWQENLNVNIEILLIIICTYQQNLRYFLILNYQLANAYPRLRIPALRNIGLTLQR